MNTHEYFGYSIYEWGQLPFKTKLKLMQQHEDEKIMVKKQMDAYKRDSQQLVSLGCCKKATTPDYTNLVCSPVTEEVEKENNMNTSIQVAVNDDQTKRYLKDRLYAVTHEKRTALSRKFGMIDDEAPRTANELIKRITDGKYVIRKDRGDSRTYSDSLAYINWRDPAVTKDEAGFDAANDKLEKAQTAVKDQIVVLDAEKGLAALQTFEAAEIA